MDLVAAPSQLLWVSAVPSLGATPVKVADRSLTTGAEPARERARVALDYRPYRRGEPDARQEPVAAG